MIRLTSNLLSQVHVLINFQVIYSLIIWKIHFEIMQES